MKAAAIAAFDTPAALREDVPTPTPAPNEVLVRVDASSVNPADSSIATGMLKQMWLEYEFPVILGRDYAGVVERVGAAVSRYSVGDEVFGFLVHANPTVHDGKLGRADRELGVNELLPRDGDLAAAAHERHPDGFDAVLGLVNYAPDVPATLVKEGGAVASPTGAAGEGPGRTMVAAAPTPENLQRLAALLADGTLRVPIQATYELAQAPDALTALGTTHTQGKLAVRIR
jgi:NADPH:quinone reductase-like Zn-dependent oxidoreductase